MRVQCFSCQAQLGQTGKVVQKGCIQAVIVGGGISGLLSAHVLAPYCHLIHIIDKDDLAHAPRVDVPSNLNSVKWRKGVPHMCQPHQLTAGGIEALDCLLPGFRDEILSLGGVDLDLAEHVYYFDHGGSYPSFPSNLRGLGVSRPFLEQCLRERIYQEHGTKLRVVNDTMEDIELRDCAISGVLLKRQGLVPCDVYIDAAGRSSKLPSVLAKHGYETPKKLSVDAKIKSVSRVVKIPETFDEEWKLLVIKSLPSGTRGGSLLPMEGGLWQAILADAGASKIPLTDDEFLSFAKSLPDGTMHKVLESATPMTKISHYQAMKNEKLLYDQILVPAGIWPLGDSAQRLNPIYGQGITVAAQSALTLSNCLRMEVYENQRIELDRLSRLYITKLYRLLENSWNMAVASDSRFPTTVMDSNGANVKMNKFQKVITNNLLSQAQRDPKLYLRLLEIAHLTKPADSLSKDFYVIHSLVKTAWHSLISYIWHKTP